MTSAFDHDRCSKLLAAYVRGELDEARRDALERHLAGCAGCSAEEAAVRALLTPAGEGLSELERARLRRAVAAEIAPVPGLARPSLRARLYPALGAAAALLVLFFAGYLTVRGGNGDAGAGADASFGEQSSRQGPEAGAPAPLAETPGGEGRDQAGVAAEALMDVGPLYEGDLGDIDRAELADLAAHPPFPAFAAAYDAGDADAKRRVFADRLADAWNDPAARACIAALLSEEPGALPALGAVARLDGEPVLIVGAARAPSGSGPLRAYIIVAYDPNCTRRTAREGPIPR